MTAHPIENIRNFAIIAHIDHGKSTLADRLIQQTGTIAEREMVEQVLDSMDIERERGITIKAQTVRLEYQANDGKTYVLNLMDTPGHVDFAYEVSRSLAACEGSLLVVDASQGVEAQTLANVYHALDAGHEIVPVLNKIDLPAAEPDRVKEQIEDVIGLDASEAIEISAKTGFNIDRGARGDRHPPAAAQGRRERAAQGAPGRLLVRRLSRRRGAGPGDRRPFRRGMRIRMMGSGAAYEVDRIGVFRPKMTETDKLGPGEIGYITAQIKQVADTRVGDTITDDKRPTAEALPGFKPAQPVVFCGLFPADAADFEALRAAMGRLRLNDASFSYEMETSAALGFGFRCGFLGLLHLEIIQERLEREFNLDLIATAPSVIYRIALDRQDGDRAAQPGRHARRGQDRRDQGAVDQGDDPHPRRLSRRDPQALPGPARRAGRPQLCRQAGDGRLRAAAERGGVRLLRPAEVDLRRAMPRSTISSSTIAPGDLVKMSILVNGEPVDALSMLVHRDRAEARGRAMVEKLKELIPPHMFQIPIQAAIGGKIIARETIRALRKDVTAKCYGGDATRKRKLLEKQKAGKKKMRQFGKVEIPQEAFIAALKMDS